MKTKSIEDLSKHIGVNFSDISFLRTACTHRSYINENKTSGGTHNERLEFLGDAVLELVVTSFLFRKYPKKQEGELTAFRSSIVNTVSLTIVAEKMGLNDYMLMSKGEAKDSGRARSVILANAVEAVIGAIYMDGGYNTAANMGPNHYGEHSDWKYNPSHRSNVPYTNSALSNRFSNNPPSQQARTQDARLQTAKNYWNQNATPQEKQNMQQVRQNAQKAWVNATPQQRQNLQNVRSNSMPANRPMQNNSAPVSGGHSQGSSSNGGSGSGGGSHGGGTGSHH